MHFTLSMGDDMNSIHSIPYFYFLPRLCSFSKSSHTVLEASWSNFITDTKTVTSAFLFCELGVSWTLLMTFMSVLLEYKLKHLFQKVLKGNIFFSVSFNCKGLYFALGSNGAFPGYRCYVKVIFPACSLGCLSIVFSLMRCLAPARALLFVDFPVGAFPSNPLHHPACMHTQYA